jgi:ABC-type Fe3+-hydroxamate transport system substrate-binding protein
MPITVLSLFALLFITACSGGSSSTIPQPITPPTTSSYVVVGADNKSYTIPAEPDAATNKSTLPGVDSNADGIRDDVERWIAATWKPGSKEYFAVRQLARDSQRDVTDINSINNITKHSRMDETAKAVACLWVTYPGFSGINKISDDIFIEIDKQTLNTAARWKAYREGSSKMSGAISDGKYDGLPESIVCERE